MSVRDRDATNQILINLIIKKRRASKWDVNKAYSLVVLWITFTVIPIVIVGISRLSRSETKRQHKGLQRASFTHTGCLPARVDAALIAIVLMATQVIVLMATRVISCL